MDIYKAKCPICESPFYYYPAKLLLEFHQLSVDVDLKNEKTKVVSGSCTGEKGGVKHTEDYIFPTDFTKL
ncbi:MAG: hypothetical protein QM737_02425 [Ferruginibacter sp.]